MPTSTSASLSYKRLEDELPRSTSPSLPRLRLENEHSIKSMVLAEKRSEVSKQRQAQKKAASASADLKTVPEGEWERYLQQSNRCVLFPAGPRKTTWDMLLLVLILYSCISVPFRIGLGADAEGQMYIFEVVVTLCFCTDLILNFFTAYTDGDLYVVNHSMIMVNYLSSWFVIDLLSSLPLELIEMAAGSMGGDDGAGPSAENSQGLKMLRALRLVRLLRLLRLLKVSRYIGMLEEKVDVNLQILSLIKMILGLLYLMHILGCFWFYLAAHPAEGVDATWLATYDDGSGLDAPTEIQYLYSVYWALMTLTTVGYGDITPANDAERMYALMSLLVGALVFGYILSSVGDLMGNMDQNAVAVESKLTDVKNLLRWHRVPRGLALRISRFYEFYYTRTSPLDEDAIYDGLPPALRREMMEHLLSRSVVSRVPMLNLPGVADVEMLLEALSMLKPIVREPKELLREAFAPPECIWFLSRGSVEATGSSPTGKSLPITYYHTHETGELLGEAAIARKPGFERLVSRLRSELFVLGIDDLGRLLRGLSASGRDAVASFIITQMLQRQRARSTVLQMAVKRLAFNIREQRSRAGTTGHSESLYLPRDDPLVIFRAALIVQRMFVRMHINAFVENDTVTVDQLLPVIFDGGAKPRNAEAQPSESIVSQVTPRGLLKAVAEEEPGGPPASHQPRPPVHPTQRPETSAATTAGGGQTSWRAGLLNVRAASHRPSSPPMALEGFRPRDAAERRSIVDAAVAESEQRMVTAMGRIVSEVVSAQFEKQKEDLRKIIAQEVAARLKVHGISA